MPRSLKFKGWMAENGVKQSEIAELLNIDVGNVNEKVNNKQPWTLAQVQQICSHYGISADFYFIN